MPDYYLNLTDDQIIGRLEAGTLTREERKTLRQAELDAASFNRAGVKCTRPRLETSPWGKAWAFSRELTKNELDPESTEA